MILNKHDLNKVKVLGFNWILNCSSWHCFSCFCCSWTLTLKIMDTRYQQFLTASCPRVFKRKGSTSLGAVNLVKMVKITEVPTLSIVLNLLYRMQQKFRRSTVKKGRITLERNPMVDIVSPWSISQLRSRVIRPFLTVDRRNFCCIR